MESEKDLRIKNVEPFTPEETPIPPQITHPSSEEERVQKSAPLKGDQDSTRSRNKGSNKA